MLSEAINYPREGEDAVRTIGIGSLLTLFGFLLLPILPVFGYALRVLDAASRGEADEPPAFDDWEGLFVDGLKAAVVGFVYSLVPAAVLAVFAGGAVLAFVSGDNALGALGALTAVVGALVALALWLVVWYVAPAAMVHVARERSIGAGFRFAVFRPVLTNGKYATGWLVAFGVAVVVGVVSSVVSPIPLLGFLAMAVVSFYATVVAAYIYGSAYRAATEDIATRDRPTDRGATA